MKRSRTDLFIHLLVALAVSLVVNFSYLLLLFESQRNEWRPRIPKPGISQEGEGLLSVSPDGHGYLLYASGDSVYVPLNRIRWFNLKDGDRMKIDVGAPRHAKAHPYLNRIYRVNGNKFNYGEFYGTSFSGPEIAVQLLFYFFCSWLLICILLRGRERRASAGRLVWTVLLALALIVATFLLAPVSDRNGMNINILHPRSFDPVLLLKCSFTMIVSILYVWIRRLVWRQQAIEIEIEQLKNESLTARYDMLVGQISPHFFFNSLNSLSMLVRDRQEASALRYIEQLSYCFRYILQNSRNTLIPLAEELKFAEAFTAQYRIRYADKLFFDFAIEPRFASWLLPALSLQPLIGNTVKHNTITLNKPLHVTIRTTADGLLEVSNPIVPKLEPEPSTGIGLKNLENRWRLITGRHIEIQNDGRTFTVRLPLLNPDEA